ncbi:hypothetical protein SDC9_94757 [bioreactor metagenome]|uniref:site-specific DNA-methyltransferase (adenine-specific) n=1 Tax=bioreactor metagenome TaxID=1076179 RepID=A0A645A521_9ZZZZ
MDRFPSPLRYPGGKLKISDYVKLLIQSNDLVGCSYIEPFAGGAAVALDLLYSGTVDRLILNDADYNLYAFWFSVLHCNKEFLEKVRKIEVTLEEWYKQSEILKADISTYSILEKGFATFFLNRCNRSGILKAGPIGGKKQTSNWKIDSRFVKERLLARIEKVGSNSDNVEIHNLDAIDFLVKLNNENRFKEKHFVYLDPPYFQKGKELYLNYYNPEDHKILAEYLLANMKNEHWMVSYDKCDDIDAIYAGFRSSTQDLRYCVHNTRGKGTESVFYSDMLITPMHS